MRHLEHELHLVREVVPADYNLSSTAQSDAIARHNGSLHMPGYSRHFPQVTASTYLST